MSSTFRRRSRDTQTTAAGTKGHYATPLLRGTKPWTGGITLTSVGLRDLDSILGGGQPLGTCLLLEDDRWTPDLALCLTRYWCAQCVSHRQTLLVLASRDDDPSDFSQEASPSLADDLDESGVAPVYRVGASRSQVQSLLQSLPRNLHRDKEAGSIAQAESNKSQPLGVLEEEEEEDKSEAGLQIAWQYKKSIQQHRLGHKANTMGEDRGTSASTSDIYCHSYDLSGRMAEQLAPDWWSLGDSRVHVLDGLCCKSQTCRSPQCGYRIYQRLLKLVKQKCNNASTVVRLLLHLAPVQTTAVALPLLLSYIRAHRLPVVVLVTIQAWTCPSRTSLTSLRRVCDVVLQTRGFVSRAHYPPPPEFRHLHGLLLLPKVSVVTGATARGGGHFSDMTNTKRPPAHVYGLKRDRRKLHIPLLHIPPEDYAGGGSSVGSGVRSGGGRPSSDNRGTAKTNDTVGCSSGMSSLLDF